MTEHTCLSDEEAKKAFSLTAIKFQLKGEIERPEWCDEETTEQTIIRMTLEYVQAGLMDWAMATSFIKGIFDPEGRDA